MGLMQNLIDSAFDQFLLLNISELRLDFNSKSSICLGRHNANW